MAFVRVEPVQVQVRTNWISGRPREITWGDERLPITRLAAVQFTGTGASCAEHAVNAAKPRAGTATRIACLIASLLIRRKMS